MNKLWNLREWLTIDEAAVYLTQRLDRRVSETDVLRLALDGHLKLSVHLPAQVDAMCFDSAETSPVKRPRKIDGIWELPMAGAAKLEIEKWYHRARGLGYIELDGKTGAVVERQGATCPLTAERSTSGMSPQAATSMPRNAVIVIRTTMLSELVTKISGQSPESSDEQKRVEWLDYWKQQDAWTPREFAQLCCGLNPNGVDNFRGDDGMAQFNEAREAIKRAVRVKILPTIEDLAWPPTGPEQFYDATPTFKPSEVVAWAATRYPKAFPYVADEWKRPVEAGTERSLGQRERDSLLAIIAGLAHSAAIDLSKTSKAAATIEAITTENGARVAARTIEEHLKLIPDALERKGKTSI